MVPAANKAKRLSSVNYNSTKTIHYSSSLSSLLAKRNMRFHWGLYRWRYWWAQNVEQTSHLGDIKVRKFPDVKKTHVILPVGTNDVAHYEWMEIVEKVLKLKSFIVEQLPTTHVVRSHPITRTDLKLLARKISNIKQHFCKLQSDMTGNRNVNSNHLNSRWLY